MKEFMKLMEKKKSEKPMDENYKQAKMGALKNLKDQMSEMMGSELKGLKKVTVASPDKEGLEKGLEKAEEVVGQMPEDESKEMPEMSKEEDMEGHDMEDMGMDEIEQMMAMLQKKKEELQAKKA